MDFQSKGRTEARDGCISPAWIVGMGYVSSTRDVSQLQILSWWIVNILLYFMVSWRLLRSWLRELLP